MVNSKKNIKYHFFAFLVLGYAYFVSILFFGDIVINPHDNLDIGPILSKLIEQIYRGNFEIVNLLQAENFKWYFLDKIFYPANIFQLILSDKSFHFFEEILKKLISYYAFYLLAKSFSKNTFISCVGAIIYTTLINILPYPHSYFLPFLPYLVYVLSKKSVLSLRESLVIFLISLNSSIIFDYILLIVLLPLAYYLKKNKNTLKIFFQFVAIFSLGCFIAAIPIFITVLNLDLHRDVWVKLDLFEAINLELREIFGYFQINNVNDIFKFPYKILVIIIIFTSIFIKEKKIFEIFSFLIFFYFLKIIFQSDFLNFLFIEPISFLKGFNFSRIGLIFPVIFSIIIILNLEYLKSNKLKLLISSIIIFSSLSLQSNFLFNEISKSFLSNNLNESDWNQIRKLKSENKFYDIIKIVGNKENYKNNEINFQFESQYTFENYYKLSEYKVLKESIKDEIVISIGLDPMIAAMNGIKIADGYYPIHSSKYKNEFYKIIKNELETNEFIFKYFNNWGNRMYIFYNDRNNLKINFKAAKNMNIGYVISAFKIYDNELEEACLSCNGNKDLNLYKIK